MNYPADQTTERCRLCSFTLDDDETEIDIHKHLMDEHDLRERLVALHETVAKNETEST
jgi:hypothetical protein